MPIQTAYELTARERELMQHDKELLELQMAHAMRLKEADIALAKLEAKWNTWLRIPALVILLPVKFVLAFGYLVAATKGTEPSESFWATINGRR